MRFCQTDGTPLVEVKEDAAPPDPYATMVANKDDIASVISSSKESSSAPPPQQEDDLLDISGSDDFMKTSVVSEAELREMSIGRDAAENSSSSPFPAEPTSGKKSESSDFSSPPPRFSEPDLNPPSFGDSPFSSPKTPPLSDSEKSAPPKFDSPFSSEPPKRNLGSDPNSSSPIPSPFGEKMPPSYQTPSNPPFAPPEFREEEIKAEALNTPFAEEVSRENQQMAQNEWAPPASPSDNFGERDLGQSQSSSANSPNAAGQNKTLSIVSLILGILSIPCCGFIVLGVAAVITGFMAKGKVDKNPNEYGGRSLALAGIAIGAITTLIGIIGNLLALLGVIPIPTFK